MQEQLSTHLGRPVWSDQTYSASGTDAAVALDQPETNPANGFELLTDRLSSLPNELLYEISSGTTARALKRGLDIAGATAALIFLVPVFLLLALAIRWDSPGPALYVSERVGLRGRKFRCFKLRTMVPHAEQLRIELAHLNERDGVLFKIRHDPRITRVGRVLRKYSLDELPQFWNVLRGDMSLVGPRPSLQAEVEQYSELDRTRLNLAPGLTGLWQVEARSDPSFQRYIELDCRYVQNWSLGMDLRLIARTIGVVLSGTGT